MEIPDDNVNDENKKNNNENDKKPEVKSIINGRVEIPITDEYRLMKEVGCFPYGRLMSRCFSLGSQMLQYYADGRLNYCKSEWRDFRSCLRYRLGNEKAKRVNLFFY